MVLHILFLPYRVHYPFIFFFFKDVLFFILYFFKDLILFIFGCVGPSLLCMGFLQSSGGFSCCGAQALGVRAQQLWHAGSRGQAQQLWRTVLVSPQHVGSSRTRDRTCVPCIGRWILIHCATREVPIHLSLTFKILQNFVQNPQHSEIFLKPFSQTIHSILCILSTYIKLPCCVNLHLYTVTGRILKMVPQDSSPLVVQSNTNLCPPGERFYRSN